MASDIFVLSTFVLQEKVLRIKQHIVEVHPSMIQTRKRRLKSKQRKALETDRE